MKKLTLAITLLLAATVANSAWAKPPKLYGAIEQEYNIQRVDGQDSENFLDSDLSTIGIKGAVPLSDDLNTDLKFIYNASVGLNAEDGGSHVWKNLFLIVKTKTFGALKMGRGKTFMGIAGDKSIDQFDTNGMDSSVPGFVSEYIGYTTPRVFGFQAGISNSDDLSAASIDSDNTQAMVNFANGPAKVYVVRSVVSDSTKKIPSNAIVPFIGNETLFVGARYNLGPVMLFGAHENIEYNKETIEDRTLTSVGINFQPSIYGVTLGGQKIEGSSSAPLVAAGKQKTAGKLWTAEIYVAPTKNTQVSLGHQVHDADTGISDKITTVSFSYSFGGYKQFLAK